MCATRRSLRSPAMSIPSYSLHSTSKGTDSPGTSCDHRGFDVRRSMAFNLPLNRAWLRILPLSFLIHPWSYSCRVRSVWLTGREHCLEPHCCSSRRCSLRYLCLAYYSNVTVALVLIRRDQAHAGQFAKQSGTSILEATSNVHVTNSGGNFYEAKVGVGSPAIYCRSY